MISSKIQKALSKSFFNFLEKFSMNMNVSYFKKIVDYMFELVEKITMKLEKLLPLYSRYYEDLIDNEIRLAKISSLTRVVHIGCGSIPSTSILIAKKTGANVVGIDKNPHAVEKARYCINKLGFDDKIQIKHADAVNFPIKEFDVIVISHGVESRDKILRNISKSIKENTVVIFRTFSTNLGELAKYDAFLNDIFDVNDIARHKRHGLVISVSLSKK